MPPKKTFKRLLAAAAALLCAAAPAAAEAVWDVEAYGGSAWNADLPLTIRQAGYPDLRLNAVYHTRPYNLDALAPYYDVRVARWDGGSGWELEELHDKLFLVNDIPALQEFRLTHGFNYVFVNRAYKRGTWTLRLGAGPVLTHAEMTVRGQDADVSGDLGYGYNLSGGGIQGEVGKRIYFLRSAFAALDVKLTGAYAVVPLSGGYAEVWNLALQYQAGLGVEF